MSHFAQDYIVIKLPKEGVVRTTMSELSYYSSILEEWIIVPVGFRTDLGSIPASLQWLFPKDGKAVLAYIIHDYIYSIAFRDDRSMCDDVLSEAMEVLGVSWWKRKSVRGGLRVGGWYAWNRHKQRLNKDEYM